MFGVDLESKRGDRVKTEARTEPPPNREPALKSGRATKMFFGVEVEDDSPSTGPEFNAAAASAPAAYLPPEPTTQNSEVSGLGEENTGETRAEGGFSLQTLFGVITVFALLCGMCLAVAIAARTERTRQRERAELAEEKVQTLESNVKLIHGRLSELESDKAQLTAQLDSARNELAQKAEAKKPKVTKKKHR